MKMFLTHEDEKEIKGFIKDLMKKKNLRDTDFIESAGLRVEAEITDKKRKEVLFSIYRLIGYHTAKYR